MIEKPHYDEVQVVKDEKTLNNFIDNHYDVRIKSYQNNDICYGKL